MKIYIITSGAYSDYGIDSVFDSRELAVKYLGFDPDKNRKPYFEGGSTVRIERYTLNAGYNQKGWIYLVAMNRYGTTLMVNQISDMPTPRFMIQKEDWWDKNTKPNKNVIRMCVRAKDKKHAVKIVNEKRIRLIADEKFEPKEN